MDGSHIFAILVSLSALLTYISRRALRLPRPVGVMLIALVLALVTMAAGAFSPLGHAIRQYATSLLQGIGFETLLLQGMLPFLLFAGAMQIHLDDLARQKGAIAVLATVGTIASAVLVAALTWVVMRAIGVPLSLYDCMLFGALISPTDPIAVLGVMKRAGASKTLETKISAESLFNDGIGVVLFLALLQAGESGSIHLGLTARLFFTEAVGGIAFGLVLGTLVYFMLHRVDDFVVQLLLTLAAVTGGYTLANDIHVSGPLAMVVAGLIIGTHGRARAMSPDGRKHLDLVWETIDEILNVVLFMLIGLSVLVMKFDWRLLLAGALAVPITLASRWASVAGMVMVMRRHRPFSPGAIPIMVWSGLRGGLAIAMALSIPQLASQGGSGRRREIILAITYSVVIFSIVVQGLTVAVLVRRILRRKTGSI
jgi:CPA1 family monovalent cation:H+ antiporter